MCITSALAQPTTLYSASEEGFDWTFHEIDLTTGDIIKNISLPSYGGVWALMNPTADSVQMVLLNYTGIYLNEYSIEYNTTKQIGVVDVDSTISYEFSSQPMKLLPNSNTIYLAGSTQVQSSFAPTIYKWDFDNSEFDKLIYSNEQAGGWVEGCLDDENLIFYLIYPNFGGDVATIQQYDIQKNTTNTYTYPMEGSSFNAFSYLFVYDSQLYVLQYSELTQNIQSITFNSGSVTLTSVYTYNSPFYLYQAPFVQVDNFLVVLSSPTEGEIQYTILDISQNFKVISQTTPTTQDIKYSYALTAF
ncbi:hypothetical protein DLAC_06400 [Tieghemostelium lacteum]|uniref:Uncharacterized protein n=1 Tax=Tieghemostelium lacteum TaxID=361077 RepID=A0A151ZEP5_TIELA|nr:hypothetical protein DLAC_06400 [Tieghemostelium lacteum]|eukprot:KYQ92421.1 hypothetical protein DLAC_06400 [Tieghemostelium lacteum]